MSDLGDLLELLYGARSSWRTVSLTVRHWTQLERSQRAFEHFQAGERGARATRYAEATGDLPAESSFVVRTWRASEGRYREEHDQSGYGLTVVSDGKRVWTYSAAQGAIVHEPRSYVSDAGDQLLDPTPLMGAFDFQLDGVATAAGRDALRVRARPRARLQPHFPLAVSAGSDEVELLVDAARGVLLRIEARFEGEPISIVEVQEIAFDEEPPPGTFTFVPPAGEEVRTAEDAFRAEQLTVEEAAREASFTLWIPSKLRGGWQVHAVHRPRSTRPDVPETVFLVFHDDALHDFSIEEAAAAQLAWPVGERETVVRGGVEIHVHERGASWQPVDVRVVRDGTHVRITSSSLGADALVDVAQSLVPAPTDPPRAVTT